MQLLEIQIGERSFEYATFVNKRRENKQDIRRKEMTHEARKARKRAQFDEEDDDITVEDMLYGPGIAE